MRADAARVVLVVILEIRLLQVITVDLEMVTGTEEEIVDVIHAELCRIRNATVVVNVSARCMPQALAAMNVEQATSVCHRPIQVDACHVTAVD
jgi:hypothetical protein